MGYHETEISELKTKIDHHESEFATLTALISNQEDEISKLKTEISDQGTDIATLKASIDKNAEEIRILSENHQDNMFRFHVETKQDPKFYPSESDITYVKELVDTHNSIDINTGIFTAPFPGTYGFFVFANFLCTPTGHSLYVVHNQAKIRISTCYGQEVYFEYSSSISFSLNLMQGDTVKLFSANSNIIVAFTPIKFIGYLLMKHT
jgi:hypothetical protein